MRRDASETNDREDHKRRDMKKEKQIENGNRKTTNKIVNK